MAVVASGVGADRPPGEVAPVLRARDLTKVYVTGAGRRREALRGLSLDVVAGTFTSIMGPSGSGKSTLLHLLGALDAPSSGTVEIDGEPMADLDDRALAEVRRHRVGFVFQSFNLVPVLTAIENVALPGAIAGRPGDHSRQRARHLLDLVGLTDQADQRPAELSGGEQQRVAIARALFMQPVVLLADEPTGNLDSATGAQILSVLRQIHDDLGPTTLVVTHDVRVAAVGDEVVLLGDGRVERRLRLTDRTAEARERAVHGWLQPLAGVEGTGS